MNILNLIYLNKFKQATIKKICGVSLIELLMSMLIISIVFGTFVTAFQIYVKVPPKKNLKLAADLANNYLNEILTKNLPLKLPCSDDPLNSPRSFYTEICDYNNLIDHGAKDYLGNPLSGLEKFNIKIEINPSNYSSLDSLYDNSNMIKISATVTHPQIPPILISTYKGRY